jgi:hypothetical protein
MSARFLSMSFLRDALHHGELIDGLERAVFLAVAHDGFRLGGPDAVERLGSAVASAVLMLTGSACTNWVSNNVAASVGMNFLNWL